MRSHFMSLKAFYTPLNLLMLGMFVCVAFIVSPAMAQHNAFSDPSARDLNTSGIDLIAVADSVDGGTVPLGATAQVVVRFRNENGTPVETGLIRLYPSSNVSADVTLNQCEDEPLAAGAECAIALSVKGLQPGSWRVEMLMSHSGKARLVTTTLSGTVEQGEGADSLGNDVEAIPAVLDFETLNKSQTMVEPIVLRNITSTTVSVEDMYIDASANSGFSMKTECDKLAPGQACIVTIAWSPKLPGPSSGVLVVKHSGPTGLASVAIRGEYEPDSVNEADFFPEAVPGKGLLVSSQTEVDFGTGVDSSSTITVSLVNSGDAALTLRDIRIAGADSGLSLKPGGCKTEMVLSPIEACPLTISWSPTRIGALVDDIQIVHNGVRGILVLPVRGEAEASVSQDQGTVMLSNNAPTSIVGSQNNDPSYDPQKDDEGVDTAQQRAAAQNRAGVQQAAYSGPTMANPASVLDGLKITSFSPRRAIIAGPGGSRIVFDNEDVVLGGIAWGVNIQRNGIEFSHQGQRVLLLFDRSLSATRSITGSTSSSSSSGSGVSADGG